MKIEKFFYKIRAFFRKIKWFYQRGKRGYADCDLWNFDSYLEKILSNGLRDFAKSASGYPNSFETFEDWQKALNEIADLVERFNPDNCIDWDSEFSSLYGWDTANEEAEIAKEAVFDWLKKYWNSLWD